jgi:hypothetical protein
MYGIGIEHSLRFKSHCTIKYNAYDKYSHRCAQNTYSHKNHMHGTGEDIYYSNHVSQVGWSFHICAHHAQQ